jgi:nifR3 family TIM-barrel protein
MTALFHPLQIGSVYLNNNLALAPMAGTTDLVFRSICRRYGAALTVTELVSARGIVHDPDLRHNWRFLALDPDDTPVAIQLFGHDPDDFRQAITIIQAHPILSRCSLIDLNMGCPVRKVVQTGAGSALMQTPDLAERIVAAAVKTAAGFGCPVTVKCRSGWDAQHVNAASFAARCASVGAAAITVHARTRDQMYGGQADWTVLAAVKAAVPVPVFGNGDVRTAADARRMLLETGVDGVMVGRASLGRPWIFRQILQERDNPDQPQAGEPDFDEQSAVIKAHYQGLTNYLGEATALREMRRHLAAYFRGSRQAAVLRARAAQLSSGLDLLDVLEEWRIYCGKSCEHS